MAPLRTTDIWSCNLSAASGEIQEASPEDREAAASYIGETLQSRFLRSRQFARRVLAKYVGMPALALRFRKGRYGKLHLRQSVARRVHFNISHSRGRMLVAVSLAGPVGVDLEFLRPLDADWLAQNWFSPAERLEWALVPESRRLQAFFHGWARKEAYLKATGFGLAMPLDAFSVSLDPARAKLREIRGREPQPWRLSSIEAGPEFAGALVTFGDPGVIRMRGTE